jgi:hypothetical protein
MLVDVPNNKSSGNCNDEDELEINMRFPFIS